MRRPRWLRLKRSLTGLALLATPTTIMGQDPHAELIELSRALFETMILSQDASLLFANSTESYLVIAPGGVVEERDQVIRGLGAFTQVDSITITNERVVVSNATGVVVDRLQIHGPLVGPMRELGPMSAMTVFGRDASGRWIAVSRSLTPCDPRAVARGIC